MFVSQGNLIYNVFLFFVNPLRKWKIAVLHIYHTHKVYKKNFQTEKRKKKKTRKKDYLRRASHFQINVLVVIVFPNKTQNKSLIYEKSNPIDRFREFLTIFSKSHLI